MGPPASETSLVCPVCGEHRPATERFCPACHLPLVRPGAGAETPLSERQRWARKIKPQLSEGRLIKVAWARNQSEAEFIAGLLLEEGVPSLIRRSAGFDVPDFLAAGPRDVLVPISGLDTAREILLEAELIDGAPAGSRSAGRVVSPVRLALGILLALVIGALVIWLIGSAVG
jgi:hypothetical protein